jgi:hypothetical protein
MDDRASERSERNQIIQLVVVSVIAALLYAYLANHDTPKLTIMEVVKGVIKLVTLQWGRIEPYVWYVFSDLLLFVVIFVLWLAFFVQFALPLRNFVQRLLAVQYGLRFALGQHGPAARVDDGSLPAEYPLGKPHKPAVLVLDTASAGVLRTRAGFTRSIGPGLTFTRQGEYLAGVVDLHGQLWPRNPRGPRGEEDPFAPQGESESDEAYRARQERRFETSEKSRDGVEVVPNISTVSLLDTEVNPVFGDEPPQQGLWSWLARAMQGEPRSRFKYNPEAVRRVITAEAFASGANIEPEKRRIEWHQLPVILATDLWREYLRKFTFEELFRRLPDHGNKTGLQVIQEQVKARLTRDQVDELDDTGRQTGGLLRSREYDALRLRGIKVVSVNLRNFCLDARVDQQLEDLWFSAWERRAMDERDFVERRRTAAQREGELEALRDFARFAGGPLLLPGLSSLPRPRQDDERFDQMRLTVEALLRGTLRQARANSQLNLRIAGELKQLTEMLNWLERG